MLKDKQVEDVIHKIADLLQSMHEIMKQHNIMLFDLYERIIKLEEKNK